MRRGPRWSGSSRIWAASEGVGVDTKTKTPIFFSAAIFSLFAVRARAASGAGMDMLLSYLSCV